MVYCTTRSHSRAVDVTPVGGDTSPTVWLRSVCIFWLHWLLGSRGQWHSLFRLEGKLHVIIKWAEICGYQYNDYCLLSSRMWHRAVWYIETNFGGTSEMLERLYQSIWALQIRRHSLADKPTSRLKGGSIAFYYLFVRDLTTFSIYWTTRWLIIR